MWFHKNSKRICSVDIGITWTVGELDDEWLVCRKTRVWSCDRRQIRTKITLDNFTISLNKHMIIKLWCIWADSILFAVSESSSRAHLPALVNEIWLIYWKCHFVIHSHSISVTDGKKGQFQSINHNFSTRAGKWALEEDSETANKVASAQMQHDFIFICPFKYIVK